MILLSVHNARFIHLSFHPALFPTDRTKIHIRFIDG